MLSPFCHFFYLRVFVLATVLLPSVQLLCDDSSDSSYDMLDEVLISLCSSSLLSLHSNNKKIYQAFCLSFQILWWLQFLELVFTCCVHVFVQSCSSCCHSVKVSYYLGVCAPQQLHDPILNGGVLFILPLLFVHLSLNP